ncbi:MAG: thioredoxin family protein [bacterium]
MQKCLVTKEGKTCSRKEPYKYITQDIGLIRYAGSDKENDFALMLGNYEKQDQFYYKVLTKNGLKHVPVLEFRKNLATLSMPEKVFATYDRADQSRIRWKTRQALYEPAQKNTLLFFTSPYCVYCKEFMALVDKDKELQDALKDYRVIKLDKEVDYELVKKYRVDGYPRFIVLDNDLKEIRRKVGYDKRDNLINIFANGGV